MKIEMDSKRDAHTEREVKRDKSREGVNDSRVREIGKE